MKRRRAKRMGERDGSTPIYLYVYIEIHCYTYIYIYKNMYYKHICILATVPRDMGTLTGQGQDRGHDTTEIGTGQET